MQIYILNYNSTTMSIQKNQLLKHFSCHATNSCKLVIFAKTFKLAMEQIVILDGYAANSGDMSWENFKNLGNVTVYDRTEPEEVVGRLKDATAAFTNKVVINEAIMSQLPNLRFIGILATGYNNVDIAAANKHGITVCNVPAYSTESVVQTVFAHLLNITNRIAAHSDSVKNGDWQKCPDFSYRLSNIEELYGATMAIYGLGNIGRRVAEVAHAFGMRVIALTSKQVEELPNWIEKVDKEQLFRQADVLSINAPLTHDNIHFVNSATISLMKPWAIIINTARGPLIDEESLAEALDKGRIKAAGIDVLSIEPPTSGNRLIGCQNCEITPHIAWQSTAARERLLETAAENLRLFIAGTPRNVVKN